MTFFTLRTNWAYLFAALLLVTAVCPTSAQVGLTGTAYNETFDNLGAGLPTGWTVRTGATVTSLGTSTTLATSQTLWTTATGNFRNVASADGLTSGANATQQNASPDRALAVRQTGGFGDPGAAFVLQLANTTGLRDFALTFKLQSLDASSPRTVTWRVDYSTEATPTTFTDAGASGTLTTGNSTFANNTITANFGPALNDVAGPVWIRVVTAGPSTGSGNRPTTGIDDATLTYAPLNTANPTLAANPTTLSFTTTTGTASAPQTYILTGSNLTANVTVSAPAGFEVSTDGTNFLDEATVGAVSGSVSTTLAVRLTGTNPGVFSGTVLNVSGTTSTSVAVGGQVNDPAPTAVLTANPSSLTGFSTTQGTASAAQTYTLTATNLGGQAITVQAPDGVEVALATGTLSYTSTLTVTPVSNDPTYPLISVRLSNAAAAGTVNGTITNVSGSLTATVAVSGQVNAAPTNSLYYNLAAAPFTQDWTNVGLITTEDIWGNVPSIIGYRGDDLTTATGTNPQTILAGTTTPVDVIANQTNPNGLNTGGVAEFDGIANPVVALQGSGTADAPHLVLYLNTTGVTSISVAYNLRDIDGSLDNSIQQVALQYRIGETGNFTNIPAGYVTDASAGPSSTTLVTPINLTLPADAENQPQVQLRIMTTNAGGNDEWIGVDDIVVTGTTGTATGPTVSIQATDASAAETSSDPGTFVISRTGSTTAALMVNYTVGTGAGQATNGTDYTPTLSGTITIDAGQTTATLIATPVDDAVIEGNETIVLSLTTGDGYTLSSPRSATVILIDNDVVAGSVRIHDIQGAAHIAPLAGQTVTNVPGIVTVLTQNGFYVEDSLPDADPATSEGIFVFTSSAPGVSVGDALFVSGTVTEFRPGNNASNLSTTQIANPTVSLQSGGNALPNPTVISSAAAPAVRIIPTRVISNDFVNGDVETSTFDPTEDGLDFFESLEGMRVQINNPLTTGFRNANGELFVIADNGNGATGKNARNTITISGPDATDINSALINSDFNPERIQIDDVLSGALSLPNVNVGSLLSTIIGVVSYDFQNYEVLPTIAPTVVTPNPIAKEVTALAPTTNQLTIATFNVENLDPTDPDDKFNGLAGAIVTNLKSPDILSLEEIQDNNGAAGGTVEADQTFQKLINAITTAGGPTYEFRQVNPVDGTNGGEPGGNIRVGFLFNPARVTFVDRPGGSPTTAITVNNVNGSPQLSASPGLVDPTNSAFSGSRKPIVGEFTFNGQTVFVIGNHFTSRGGSGSPTARFQPPAQGGQGQRESQAAIVNAFVDQILAVNASANVVVLGDFNEFQFFPALQILEGNVAGQQPVLFNLISTLPVEEQYTYNFDGNAQALDHILVSSGLNSRLDAFDAVHINSEFLDQLSDHDPSLARFNFGSAATPLALTAPTYNCQTGAFTFNTTGGDGTPITYQAVGITGPTTNPNQFVDAGLRTAADAQPITLYATQSGVTVQYTFNIRAVCPVGPTPPVSTSALQLTIPTYNCQTGAFTFNTTGGDGTIITYQAIGITGPTTNPNQFVDAGLRTASDAQPITLYATQSGVTVQYTFDIRAFCPVGPPNPPVSTSALTLTAPTYNCQTGAFTFNTMGGDGTTITYSAVGVTGPTTNPNQFVDAGLRTATDIQPLTLYATQSGVTVQYTFDIRAACPVGARKSAEPTNESPLQLRVLGNPVQNGRVTVEVLGAADQPLTLSLTDSRGQTIGSHRIEQAGSRERYTFELGRRSAGLLLLRAVTPTQSQTVKVLAVE